VLKNICAVTKKKDKTNIHDPYSLI